jgi:hypothetical protein
MIGARLTITKPPEGKDVMLSALDSHQLRLSPWFFRHRYKPPALALLKLLVDVANISASVERL